MNRSGQGALLAGSEEDKSILVVVAHQNVILLNGKEMVIYRASIDKGSGGLTGLYISPEGRMGGHGGGKQIF
jgi:hypothetical protein